jgi:hypothetical protein
MIHSVLTHLNHLLLLCVSFGFHTFFLRRLPLVRDTARFPVNIVSNDTLRVSLFAAIICRKSHILWLLPHSKHRVQTADPLEMVFYS